MPLLNATIVENAWQIALLWYVGTNLQFITFFGAAIFSVFCTGNRFAMAVVYAVLNGGEYILYYIINTIDTMAPGTPLQSPFCSRCFSWSALWGSVRWWLWVWKPSSRTESAPVCPCCIFFCSAAAPPVGSAQKCF